MEALLPRAAQGPLLRVWGLLSALQVLVGLGPLWLGPALLTHSWGVLVGGVVGLVLFVAAVGLGTAWLTPNLLETDAARRSACLRVGLGLSGRIAGWTAAAGALCGAVGAFAGASTTDPNARGAIGVLVGLAVGLGLVGAAVGVLVHRGWALRLAADGAAPKAALAAAPVEGRGHRRAGLWALAVGLGGALGASLLLATVTSGLSLVTLSADDLAEAWTSLVIRQVVLQCGAGLFGLLAGAFVVRTWLGRGRTPAALVPTPE